MSAHFDTGAVDAENPWPGLAAFREADREFFHGRQSEADELLRRVQRERLTILFGLSGLGKTSLLQAGLFQRLRDENILPVPIRLDYSTTRRPLAEQVRDAIARAAKDAGIEAPQPRTGETLWELFHRRDAEFWNARNRLVTPLLVLDQFEEIFTLGQQDGERARESAAWVGELASLCDGNPSKEVRDHLDANPSEIRGFVFDRHPYKLLFSLREDFLPDLEALRGRIGAIAHNRMRLLGMSGKNALQVVTQAGSLKLVDAETAEKIVRFVASQDEEDIPLADLDVDPALLSFVCRELNTRRRLQGAARITAELLAGTRETIFVGFYERSVGDLDPRVRTFIEDRLLTKSGFRNSEALENAREAPGINDGVIKTLTDRRLLRIEDRGGQPRIELTHDVLTGAIRSSRDTRRQREAQEKAEAARKEAEAREEEARQKLRRSRMVIAALGLLLLGVIGLAWWGWNAKRQAQKALANAEVERALHTLQEGRSASALAYLAQAVRTDPDNLTARSWLVDILFHHAWLLPTRELQRVDGLRGLRFSQDGQRVAVFDEKTIWVWDAATGRHVGPPIRFEYPRNAMLSMDGRRLFALDYSGNARLWETKTGEPLGPPLSIGNVLSFQLSPDGLLAAVVRIDGALELLETRTGALAHRLTLPGQQITDVSFGPQDSLVTVSTSGSWPENPQKITLWDVRKGNPVSTPASPPNDLFLQSLVRDPEHPAPMGLSSDGSLILANIQNSVVLIDRSSGENRGWGGNGAKLSSFEVSQDGRLLMTLASDRSVTLWSSWIGRALFEPLEGIAAAALSSDGLSLVTASTEGSVRLWTVHPGGPAVGQIQFDPTTYKTEISPDAKKIAEFSNGKVSLWNLSSLLQENSPLPVPFRVSDARFSADGQWLAACGGKVLRIWDLSSRTSWEGSFNAMRTVDVSPDGTRLATGTSRGTAQIWDPSDLSHPGQILSHRDFISTVRFSPDGQFVLTASRDQTARLWKADTGAFVGLPMKHKGPVSWAKFSSDGQRIVTTAGNREVFLWQSPSGRLERAFLHTQPTYYAELSPRGDRMVTTTMDGAVWIWDARTGNLVAGPIRPEEGQVSQIVLSPDGERFAILLPRALKAQLWNLQTGEALGMITTLQAEDSVWSSGRFTADGQRLVVAGNDAALIWDVPLVPPQESDRLADLAEAAAGVSVDIKGRTVALSNLPELLGTLRRKTVDAPQGKASIDSLTRWLLSDPWERTTSPLSKITVPELLCRRLSEGTEKARQEAERAYPGHPQLRNHSACVDPETP